MKVQAWLLAGMLVVAPGAWAGQCPSLVAKIDELLAANPTIDANMLTDEESSKTVQQLRDEGEAMHKEGKHSESVETLKKALDMVMEASG